MMHWIAHFNRKDAKWIAGKRRVIRELQFEEEVFYDDKTTRKASQNVKLLKRKADLPAKITTGI